MKILNLYSGIGGNRKLWNELSNDIEVTAVEYDENIAKAYQDRFPKDKVIIGDSKDYLLIIIKNSILFGQVHLVKHIAE